MYGACVVKKVLRMIEVLSNRSDISIDIKLDTVGMIKGRKLLMSGDSCVLHTDSSDWFFLEIMAT